MEDHSLKRNLQLRANELEERLIDFAVRIVRLSASLPRTAAGKHIASQIMRSGTSPAPNYGEARGAESQADFVHKLRIVLKELNETSIWLRIIERSRIVDDRVDCATCSREQRIVQNSSQLLLRPLVVGHQMKNEK